MEPSFPSWSEIVKLSSRDSTKADRHTHIIIFVLHKALGGVEGVIKWNLWIINIRDVKLNGDYAGDDGWREEGSSSISQLSLSPKTAATRDCTPWLWIAELSRKHCLKLYMYKSGGCM